MKKLAKYWDSLPKWVRVVPYIALSGALAALIKYLSEIQMSDALLMGAVNVAIVLLKGVLDSIKK